jgi:hypothetical protein
MGGRSLPPQYRPVRLTGGQGGATARTALGRFASVVRRPAATTASTAVVRTCTRAVTVPTIAIPPVPMPPVAVWTVAVWTVAVRTVAVWTVAVRYGGASIDS